MNILIIEDEAPALNRIRKLVKELDINIEILGTADSISSAVNLFNRFPEAELALMDIELADGQSFEIFNQVQITCPVIFTTAYDEFALKAFKVNSIDYLLKPIDPQELKQAIDKFNTLQQTKQETQIVNIGALLNSFKKDLVQSYKQRFLIKIGHKLESIPCIEIAYFMAADKLVYLVNKEGKRYIIDHTLEELSQMLDPKNFFHLNRQFLCNIESIKSINSYFNGKLKVQLKPDVNDEVLVSREKANDFKNWLNQ
ncbi:MAG: LytTR family DNA-binding domain-containing protein [Bacteroidota bacterium]|nr:LytTR family DNA-binding domain-containing protein [Bacteroidota bacterium]